MQGLKRFFSLFFNLRSSRLDHDKFAELIAALGLEATISEALNKTYAEAQLQTASPTLPVDARTEIEAVEVGREKGEKEAIALGHNEERKKSRSEQIS